MNVMMLVGGAYPGSAIVYVAHKSIELTSNGYKYLFVYLESFSFATS